MSSPKTVSLRPSDATREPLDPLDEEIASEWRDTFPGLRLAAEGRKRQVSFRCDPDLFTVLTYGQERFGPRYSHNISRLIEDILKIGLPAFVARHRVDAPVVEIRARFDRKNRSRDLARSIYRELAEWVDACLAVGGVREARGAIEAVEADVRAIMAEVPTDDERLWYVEVLARIASVLRPRLQ